jgi:calcium-binding protein CML
MAKLLSMASLQAICRESKGTDGIRCGQLIKHLKKSGATEADAARDAAAFFSDFDTLGQNRLPLKLFLDQYKTMTTLAVVNELLTFSKGSVEISEAKLTEVLNSKLEAEASIAQVRQMFHTLDADKSGTISEAELRAWKTTAEASIVAARNANIAHVVRETFDKFDADASGGLDANEFRHLCATLGEVLPEEEFARLVAILDTDGSGVISFEEFSAWFLNPDRQSVGASGNAAKVLRARMMISRGDSYLRALLSKNTPTDGVCASVNLTDFKDVQAMAVASFETTHVSKEIETFMRSRRAASYISTEWKCSSSETALFLYNVLSPLCDPKNISIDLGAELKGFMLEHINGDCLRLSIFFSERASSEINELPAEMIAPLATGGSVQLEAGFNFNSMACNFATMTLGDFFKWRVTGRAAQLPQEMVQEMAPPEEFLAKLRNKLSLNRLPVIDDIMDGKTGEMTYHLADTLVAVANGWGGQKVLGEFIHSERIVNNLGWSLDDRDKLQAPHPFLNTNVLTLIKAIIKADQLVDPELHMVVTLAAAPLKFLERDLEEMQVVHMRRNDGHGATLNTRGIFRPGDASNLLNAFKTHVMRPMRPRDPDSD